MIPLVTDFALLAYVREQPEVPLSLAPDGHRPVRKPLLQRPVHRVFHGLRFLRVDEQSEVSRSAAAYSV
jgi:hypothetical protein